MDDLRWALLILGALFLAGLGFWEMFRSRGRGSDSTPARFDPPALGPELASGRREPSIDDFSEPPRNFVSSSPDILPVELADEELPEIHAPASIRVGISPEEAVDVPGATTVVTDEQPKPIRWPPAELPERVLGLRVISTHGPLGGKPVRLALQGAGLRHGPQQIFHKVDRDGNVLASVANLVRPGSLIPEQMDLLEFRGLSLFAVLPGPLPPGQMLEGLVHLARTLASRLDALVQDENGQELDAERLNQLRRAVAAVEEPGDGAGA